MQRQGQAPGCTEHDTSTASTIRTSIPVNDFTGRGAGKQTGYKLGDIKGLLL